MQTGDQSEDIHTILSRFHTWAGKEPGNRNGRKLAPESDSVREVPYEEAMRHYRERHKTQPRRVAATVPAPPPPKASPEPETVSPAPALPVQATTAEPAPLVTSPTKARIQPPAPARRFPSFLAEATPLPSAGAPKAGKKPAAKKTSAQASAPAPPPARTSPKASRSKQSPRVSAKKDAAPSTASRTQRAEIPEFKKVLAKTIRKTPAPQTRTAKPPADRNQRITTRFSTAEQRRLERAAAQAGMTLSAWLRQCALRAEASSTPQPAPAPRARRPKAAERAPLEAPTLFSASAPSRAGWLTLLRQRFLSSPARFSERA